VFYRLRIVPMMTPSAITTMQRSGGSGVPDHTKTPDESEKSLSTHSTPG
jgi:hypothetical protein